MEARELRIGNFVMKNRVVTSATLNIIADIELYQNQGFNNFEPIPLTEEWLKRIGAEYKGEDSDDTRAYMLRIGTFNFWSDSSNDFSTIEFSDRIAVKYVHQLQNLYFALTSEELEFKD